MCVLCVCRVTVGIMGGVTVAVCDGGAVAVACEQQSGAVPKVFSLVPQGFESPLRKKTLTNAWRSVMLLSARCLGIGSGSPLFRRGDTGTPDLERSRDEAVLGGLCSDGAPCGRSEAQVHTVRLPAPPCALLTCSWVAWTSAQRDTHLLRTPTHGL